MQKNIIAAIVLLSGIFAKANAQNIDSLLEIQRSADPQEKIHVHFDKNYYNPGETIWFKAYLFTGLEPSVASKNFYAELTDEAGNVLQLKTAPITGASSSGSFDLDSNLNKSTLYFRAYTIAMLNSDTSFIYTKPIHILTKNAGVKKTVAARPPDIKFLPEGGDWIEGLLTVMAFTITDTQGLPVDATGFVKDSDGNKVIDFGTIRNGMGAFKIVAQPGKTYTAAWKDAAGKTYNTALPAPKPAGVNLQVTTDETGNKKFTLQRSENVPENLKKLRLIGYMNQRLVYSAGINMASKASVSGVFPTKDIPSGILQFTLFDENNAPLAERIAFVNNHDYEFDADVWVPVKNFAKRGLNRVEVMISDTLPANLSLSITDGSLNDAETYQENIITRLLLTGDLRGRIINPYYYFFSTSDSAAYHLDLVMLTHGWRRYNWSNVLAGKTATPKFKESNFLSLNGTVAGTIPGGFGPDAQLTGIIQTIDSAKNIVNLPITRQGKVFTDGLIFYDHARLFFNFTDKKITFDKSMLSVDNGLRKNYNRTQIDSIYKQEALNIEPDVIAKNISNNTKRLENTRQFNLRANELANVTVTGKVKTNIEKLEEKYVSGMFSGDGRQFDLISDPFAVGSQSIFQYLQGKVAGLQITTGAPPSLSWRGGTPTLYLNEMRTDADQLSNTPMTDIAYIKVFSPGQTGVISSSGGGAIAVYTKKGGDVTNTDSKGLDYVKLIGYSAIKEFYSPNYAVANEKDAYDDLRTTLYWNPYILLHKNQKRLRLQFYNNDVTKRYRVVLEGINDEGKLVHVEKEIL